MEGKQNKESLYTVIENNADLKLSGATEKHTLVLGKTPKLNLDRFAALTTAWIQMHCKLLHWQNNETKRVKKSDRNVAFLVRCEES